jgi:HD superfamily phosphohydrolase
MDDMAPMAGKKRKSSKTAPPAEQKRKSRDAMVYNDSVHTHMEISRVCRRIINTPHIQRLKNLKQLASLYYVYPAASHNRFEHSMGTCYLAGVYGRILQKKVDIILKQGANGGDEKLPGKVTDKDILCLEIAGLCHDIGHGPFSYTWERFVKLTNDKYSHEDTSLRVFDHMMKEEGLMKHLQTEGELNENDIEFIKTLMTGRRPEDQNTFGLAANKFFLYDIVANETTKIDVDKFDYLLRDCKSLGLTTAFDYQRIMANSTVKWIEKEKRFGIVYRSKVKVSLEDLFAARFHMHQVAFQHKTDKVVEKMLIDGLTAANETFKLPGKHNSCLLSTAHRDPGTFIKLTDSIFEMIVNEWVECDPATKAIFKRIVDADALKYLGYVTIHGTSTEERDSLKKISGLIVLEGVSNYGTIYGNNPLESVYFFEKKQDKLFQHEFRKVLEEVKYHLVVDGAQGDVEAVELELAKWESGVRAQRMENKEKKIIFFE